MVRIKICGITCVRDALLAVEQGADAIGLNFWPGSVRHVSIEQAAEIAASIHSRAHVVGVFVDASIDLIYQATDAVPLDLIQLHGHEPVEIARILPRPCIRAVRIKSDRAMNEEQLDAVLADPTNLHALLLDTFVAATPGGTGRIADWDLAAEIVCRSKHPVILAGGLTPDNVATAIRTVRPQGVDVASGVEDAPDRKSPTLLRQFVLAAVSTFTNLGPEPGQPTR